MAISEQLRKFLEQRLTAAEQIDIVLLLMRNADRSWTALDVASELRMPAESTAMRLFLLASGGLVAFEPDSVPRYRYHAIDASTDAMLRELAEEYSNDRSAVLSVIGGAPANPVQSFADAFKLKR